MTTASANADTGDSPRRPLRVALIGWGAIGTTVAEYVQDEAVEIVAVGVRDAATPRSGLPTNARLIDDPADLAALQPGVVVEAAGRESVARWGPAALATGADFVVSSVSAFADATLLSTLQDVAERSGSRVVIQPGALAGVEALRAARIMGVDWVEHRIVKPPTAWLGTPAEAMCELASISEPTTFFSAPANDAAAAFPKNANVAMTTALAGIGPAATTITLVADPNATTNRHELRAGGAFGSLDVAIANSPLPANPKTSALAALSLVRLITNQVSPLVI